MRLIEAIVDTNQRAKSGDKNARLSTDEFGESLPLVALTCIDARLNRLFPDVLGLREEDFIWLRNAGNIIFDPMSSMTRTLALACAVKGGREIAIIGHTDCRVRATSVNDLIERFRALGVDRFKLPDNLVEFFGLFASERQNVINAVTFVRQSSLIGPKIPVHGLLVDVQTGQLEWIVNGYQVLETALAQTVPPPGAAQTLGALPTVAWNATTSTAQPSPSEETNSPKEKAGHALADARKWLGHVQVVSEDSPLRERPSTAAQGNPPTPPAPPPLLRRRPPKQS